MAVYGCFKAVDGGEVTNTCYFGKITLQPAIIVSPEEIPIENVDKETGEILQEPNTKLQIPKSKEENTKPPG